jgi:hypothetical protein
VFSCGYTDVTSVLNLSQQLTMFKFLLEGNQQIGASHSPTIGLRERTIKGLQVPGTFWGKPVKPIWFPIDFPWFLVWIFPNKTKPLTEKHQEKVGIILKDTLPNRSRWADIEATPPCETWGPFGDVLILLLSLFIHTKQGEYEEIIHIYIYMHIFFWPNTWLLPRAFLGDSHPSKLTY